MNETKTFTKLKGKRKNNNPNKIVVHHTGGTDRNPLADTSEHTAKGVEAWHLGKGWDGIGYHYFIEKDGEVWKGRPEHRNGAHARGYNTTSIGICLAGNFDLTLPTQEQELSLTSLLKQLSKDFNIPADKIVPHRTHANKTCYGNRLSDTWARNLVIEKEHTISDHSEIEILGEALAILQKYQK